MSKLRRSLIPFAGYTLLVISLLVSARPASTQGQGKDKAPSDVNIVNTPTVNSKQSGPWNVSVTNGDQLYSAYLSVDNFTNTPAACTDIPVPEGKRLSLETVAVSVYDTSGMALGRAASIRMAYNTGGQQLFDWLSIPITLRANTSDFVEYSGHLRTRILSGGVTVGSGTVTLSLCAGRNTIVSGHIVGSLLPQ